jgi:hypothetical protein
VPRACADGSRQLVGEAITAPSPPTNPAFRAVITSGPEIHAGGKRSLARCGSFVWSCTEIEKAPRVDRKGPLTWEPPWGIEPQTFCLQGSQMISRDIPIRSWSWSTALRLFRPVRLGPASYVPVAPRVAPKPTPSACLVGPGLGRHPDRRLLPGDRLRQLRFSSASRRHAYRGGS